MGARAADHRPVAQAQRAVTPQAQVVVALLLLPHAVTDFSAHALVVFAAVTVLLAVAEHTRASTRAALKIAYVAWPLALVFPHHHFAIAAAYIAATALEIVVTR